MVIYRYGIFVLDDEELIKRGYRKRKVRANCSTDYWVSDESPYVFAIAHDTKGNAYPVIVEKSLCEKINWKSISIRDEGKKIPYCNIRIEGKVYKRNLHVLLMQDKLTDDELEIDHIYHTQYIVTYDTLRVCIKIENACNKSNRKKPKIYKRKKIFRDKEATISNSVVNQLKQRGYNVEEVSSTILNKPIYKVESPEFNSIEELEQEMDIYEDLKYGAFKYKPEEDFTDSIDLLIRHYILGELTKEAMIELNAVRMNKQQDFFKEQK